MVDRKRRRGLAGRLLAGLGVVALLALVGAALLMFAPWRATTAPDGGGRTAVTGGYFDDQWDESLGELHALLHRIRVSFFIAPWEDPARWQVVARAPVRRVEAASAVVAGRWYVIGGYLGGQPYITTTRVDVYDPAADSWTRVRDMPWPVSHINAATDGARIWVAGGFLGDDPGRATDRVGVYDTVTDSWSAGPALPVPVAGGGLVRLGRSLHYFGGLLADRDTNTADHWVLDLDGATAWQAAAPLPSPRDHFGAVAFDGMAWAVGGQYRHDNDPLDVDLVHAWDPGSGEWAAMPPLPSPRSHMEAAILDFDGRLLVVGGFDRGDAEAPRPFASTLGFDPDTGVWTAGPGLPVGLMAPEAAQIGNRLYVSGGNDIMAAGSQQRVTMYTVLE